MSKIEEIWNKYSDLTIETMHWWQFEKAAEELLKLQRDSCAKAAMNYSLVTDPRLTGLRDAILNAELEDL